MFNILSRFTVMKYISVACIWLPTKISRYSKKLHFMELFIHHQTFDPLMEPFPPIITSPQLWTLSMASSFLIYAIFAILIEDFQQVLKLFKMNLAIFSCSHSICATISSYSFSFKRSPLFIAKFDLFCGESSIQLVIHWSSCFW
jgi:hypothetical protein